MEESQREQCIETFLSGREFRRHCADWLIDLAQRLVHLRFPGRFRGQDLEDMAQDSLISAWQNRTQFRRDSHFKGWLEGVVYKKGLMRLRKTRRSPITVEISDFPVPPEPSTHDTTQDEGMISSLIAAVNLTPKEEAVFTRIMNGGGEQDEIANQLGMDTNAVKMAYRRAKNKMKNLFDFAQEGAPSE